MSIYCLIALIKGALLPFEHSVKQKRKRLSSTKKTLHKLHSAATITSSELSLIKHTV